MISEPRDGPSDASRFATTQKQRAAELFNEIDKDLEQIRRNAAEDAVKAILAGHPTDALYQMLNGVRDAYLLDEERDSRQLDPVTVLATFSRAVRRHALRAYA
jgi:hypothetical protein